MKRFQWLILFVLVTTFRASAQNQTPVVAAPSISWCRFWLRRSLMFIGRTMNLESCAPAERDVSGTRLIWLLWPSPAHGAVARTNHRESRLR
jgi:hypothetical protein